MNEPDGVSYLEVIKAESFVLPRPLVSLVREGRCFLVSVAGGGNPLCFVDKVTPFA